MNRLYQSLTRLLIPGWLILGAITTQAQLNRGGIPWSFELEPVPTLAVDLVLIPPDMEAVTSEDLFHPLPYRFAINLPVEVGISPQSAVRSIQSPQDRHPASGIRHPASGIRHQGSWIKLPSGNRIWLLTIRAPGAKAITLYFDRFNLPEGGRLFLYNQDRSRILGAFTDMNNNPAEVFATGLITGDQVTLEYNQPAQTTGFPLLHISEVAYAYRGIPEATEGMGFGSSGPCEVNIHCPEGGTWQDQQKGIARIGVKKFGATYWCSGSLVNNTRQDKIPYFLTADHCGKGATQEDINQWIFYFGYQSPTCENPPVEPTFRSMTGAGLKSASGDVNIKGSDFLLLLLNQTVPDTFDVWFNGWNRQDSPSPDGTGIHHPMGDIKKISTYTSSLVSTNWNGHPEMTHWEVIWAETVSGHGVTEGGSSGSPIFDPERRIIGALTGGEASCDSGDLTKPDYYGKFSYSWDMNGADSTDQLACWLDPDNTGAMVLDGIPMNIPEPAAITTDLLIYPNPASGIRHPGSDPYPGILHLRSSQFLTAGLIHITVVDSWGKAVMLISKPGDGSGLLTLDISTLPNGFYLLMIQAQDRLLTGRFIKL
ncbi:MAG: hypothetical protein ABIJ04_10355 [Bacteroidota bacterium]